MAAGDERQDSAESGPLSLDLMTAEQLAPIIPRMTAQGLRRLAREGLFPPGVLVRLGRRVYFSRLAFEAWLAAGGRALPGGWRRAPKPE